MNVIKNMTPIWRDIQESDYFPLCRYPTIIQTTTALRTFRRRGGGGGGGGGGGRGGGGEGWRSEVHIIDFSELEGNSGVKKASEHG